ncbi:winged helix-turn-helix domain-containing protein [Myxococcota bacterium]|nr:winged helix-turn-helix domain-containing protein [Myxococcota bacterium]
MLQLLHATIDLDGHKVTRRDGAESLTQLEVDALRYLAARRGTTVSRERLERDVWGFRPGARSEAVPVAMRRLRTKLGADGLITVRGVGWRLGEAPVDAADPTVRAAPVAKVAVSATPFVGREALLAEISARFEGGWRVVTLRGPAGVGKTRAALEAARAWPGELLPLAVDRLAPSPDAWLTLLADLLSLANASPAGLHRALAAKTAPLLVIDGAEAALEVVAEGLAALLAATPGLRALVSSRAPLGLGEEAVLEVAPLPPDLARRFFTERLRAVHPAPDAETEAIDAVVALLDGLPAALELYAARGGLGVAPLVDELRAGVQDRRLDARLQRSWDALPETEREVLLACSAFVGPFPLAAAQAAAGSRADALASLRAASLLQLDTRGELHLLATLRRFCEAQPGVAEARIPAWRWLVAQGESQAARLVTSPASALSALRELRPHLSAVVASGPPDLAARAGAATCAALALTGPNSLRQAIHDAVDPDAAPPAQRRRLRLDRVRTQRLAGVPIAELLPTLDDLQGAQVSLLRGELAVGAVNPDAAIATFNQAIAEAEAEGDVETWLLALLGRCGSASLLGRRPAAEAQADLQRARALCEQHKLQLHRAEIERVAGLIAQTHRDVPLARTCFSHALVEAQAAGLSRPIGNLWNCLGDSWMLESPAEALSCFHRAAEHAISRGETAMLAVFQLNIAITALLADQHELVGRALNESPPSTSPLVNHVTRLLHAALLMRDGEELDAKVLIGAVDPSLLGRAFSPNAAEHGGYLIRAFAVEGHVARLASDPATHAPPLRALLSDAKVERGPEARSLLDCLLNRLERKLAALQP